MMWRKTTTWHEGDKCQGTDTDTKRNYDFHCTGEGRAAQLPGTGALQRLVDEEREGLCADTQAGAGHQVVPYRLI